MDSTERSNSKTINLDPSLNEPLKKVKPHSLMYNGRKITEKDEDDLKDLDIQKIAGSSDDGVNRAPKEGVTVGPHEANEKSSEVVNAVSQKNFELMFPKRINGDQVAFSQKQEAIPLEVSEEDDIFGNTEASLEVFEALKSAASSQASELLAPLTSEGIATIEEVVSHPQTVTSDKVAEACASIQVSQDVAAKTQEVGCPFFPIGSVTQAGDQTVYKAPLQNFLVVTNAKVGSDGKIAPQMKSELEEGIEKSSASPEQKKSVKELFDLGKVAILSSKEATVIEKKWTSCFENFIQSAKAKLNKQEQELSWPRGELSEKDKKMDLELLQKGRFGGVGVEKKRTNAELDAWNKTNEQMKIEQKLLLKTDSVTQFVARIKACLENKLGVGKEVTVGCSVLYTDGERVAATGPVNVDPSDIVQKIQQELALPETTVDRKVDLGIVLSAFMQNQGKIEFVNPEQEKEIDTLQQEISGELQLRFAILYSEILTQMQKEEAEKDEELKEIVKKEAISHETFVLMERLLEKMTLEVKKTGTKKDTNLQREIAAVQEKGIEKERALKKEEARLEKELVDLFDQILRIEIKKFILKKMYEKEELKIK